jgi:hypothetical protein
MCREPGAIPTPHRQREGARNTRGLSLRFDYVLKYFIAVLSSPVILSFFSLSFTACALQTEDNFLVMSTILGLFLDVHNDFETWNGL